MSFSKIIQPYLNRAAELSSREPLVSYFCKHHEVSKLYAAQILLKMPADREKDEFLGGLMDEIEIEKGLLNESNLKILADPNQSLHFIRSFALRVFAAADNQERSGNANLATAKMFLASVSFFELQKIFEDAVDAETEEKVRYAKWKATELSKALKQPQSALPSIIQQPTSSQQVPPSSAFSLESPPAATSEPMAPSMPVADATTTTSSSSLPFVPADSNTGALKAVSPDWTGSRLVEIEKATKSAKFAVSSLQYEDVPAALQFLRDAVSRLERL